MSKGDLIRVTLSTPPTTTVVILEALGDGHTVSHEWRNKRLTVTVKNRKADEDASVERQGEFAEASVIGVERMTRTVLEKEQRGQGAKKTVRKPREPKAAVVDGGSEAGE